jgi:hypothetical protein
MGSIMGVLYYCYGSHYGNGSSTKDGKVQVYKGTRPKISCKCYVSKYTNQKSRHSHLTSYHVTLNQLIVFKQK